MNSQDLQKDSFWVKIKENDLVADVEVFKDLEELFAAKPAKVAIKQVNLTDVRALFLGFVSIYTLLSSCPDPPLAFKDDALVDDSGKKGKELRVLDPKTSQNISILLGKCPNL